MAKIKTKGSGPVLSQRDRKKLRAESNTAAKDTVEEVSEVGQQEENNSEKGIPQEEFLRWVGDNLSNSMSSAKAIQISIVLYTVHQAYLKYSDMFENEKQLNLLISSACGIVALISSLVISFRVQSNLSRTRGIPAPGLPSWDYIYLIFLPSFLALTLNQDLLLYNIALTTTAQNLPAIAKVIVQLSIITSNSDHTDLISNIKAVAINYTAFYVLGEISEFKSLSQIEVNMFSILIADLFLIKSTEVYVIILQKLFISFAVALALVYSITKVLPTNDFKRTLIIVSAWLGSFISITFYLLNPVLGENALVWLYEYATSTTQRIHILELWLGSLLLLIPTIFSYNINLSPNFRRKIWHFIILGLIAYPLYVDPEFVKVSLAGSLILFLIVEMTRYLKLYPYGEYLDSRLRTFADFRDEKGPLIISYIYLFVGVSIPVLTDNSVVGLVVLGVGDSLASIIGANYGLIKWSGSSKTLEGTATFVLSTYLVCSVFKLVGWFFVEKSFHSLLLVCTLSGILEGNSDLNDNILIPGYMLILLHCLP